MAPRLLPRALCRARPGAKRDATSALTALRPTRAIATSFRVKTEAAKQRWAARADKVTAGEITNTWDILEERGFVKDVAGNRNTIREIMRVKRTGAYVGVDPTVDSMHIGHLVPLMALFWMWYEGYPATMLLGGATARIGDPSGRLRSREALSNSDISRNIAKMHFQMSKLWHNVVQMKRRFNIADDWAAKRALLNNSMWLQGLSMYDFNKRISKFVRVGPMLSRETVKRRLADGDGMSFAELMYPLIQGWDFWHMYNKIGIQIQIGGSDQFGNIVTGIETLKIIRDSEEAPHLKMEGGWVNDPMGFTTPLLTDSGGNKLGKSEGNAVWLDEFRTTPFDLYGYFVRRSDDEVEKFLKLLTFIPTTKIQTLMDEHKLDPPRRLAQHTLAFEVVSLVHGSERAMAESQQHKFIFGGNNDPLVIKEPAPETGIVTPNNRPRSDLELPRSIMEHPPGRILHAVGLAESNSEGHRLVTKEGAYVAAAPGQERGLVPGSLSWTPLKMMFPGETSKFLIDGELLILRKGKHNLRIVKLVSDEEWKASGRTYPGQPYTGLVRRVKEQLRQEAGEQGEKLTAKEIIQKLREKVTVKVANNPDIAMSRRSHRKEGGSRTHDRQQTTGARRAAAAWSGRGRR